MSTIESMSETMSTIEYRGIKIVAEYPHIVPKLQTIVQSPKFENWINQFNFDEIDFTEFHITDVDFFGPVSYNRLGFLKGYGIATDKATGYPIPSIAFIRGNSVAVLIIVRVKETNKKYVLLCKQLRFPSGKSLIEACAGMIDEKTKNLVGVVFNEVQEETGFIINEEKLINLGSMRPSGGGCDEIINLYAWETVITETEYNEKLHNIYGENEYEKIKLLFYDFETFDNILDDIGDSKSECCWRRYNRSSLKQF
jgi:ADP-sugar diphosphatase